MRNYRLETALRSAKEMMPEIDERSYRTRFTSESARSANAKKYAGVSKKPKTATVRVEEDVLKLVKAWPTSMRIRFISEAIRGAVKAYETLENIKNG